jgi:uncharacterized protein (DUF362 family)
MKPYLILLLLFAIPAAAFSMAAPPEPKSKVYIIKTDDRVKGIKALLSKIKLPDLKNKKIILKPNFNSDDPFPATTHLDTLKTVIQSLKTASPESIAIMERSGMGDTEKVLTSRGVYDLAKKENIQVVNLDRLDKNDWVKKGTKNTHWKKGYLIPKMLLEADFVVNLCCLKTHRFGGDFTLSLKNNVGLVAKSEGFYNYMLELHTSPDQRLMIAEINKDIPCHLIILDGMLGFSEQGPEKGKLIKPGLILMSTDRVAIDAVGVAILRMFGAKGRVAKGKIFDQDQIKQASKLGIGARSENEIQIVPVNPEAKEIIKKIAF